jgi:hypothetical protein
MDFVRMMRALWHRRALVAVVAVLAVVVGIGLIAGTRTTKVGTAHAIALVDTPSSQVADLGSINTVASIATLTSRATLLTGLMTSSPLKDEIAAKAGISARNLLAASAATSTAANPSSGASATPLVPTAGSGLVSARTNLLTASVPELATGQVPMIAVDTQSPSPDGAAKLANSSLAVLGQYLQSLAAQDAVPGGRRVIIRQLGPAVASTITNGPSKALAVGAAFLVLVLGCGLILGVSAFKTGWRRAGEMDAGGSARPHPPLLIDQVSTRPRSGYDPDYPAAATVLLARPLRAQDQPIGGGASENGASEPEIRAADGRAESAPDEAQSARSLRDELRNHHTLRQVVDGAGARAVDIGDQAIESDGEGLPRVAAAAGGDESARRFRPVRGVLQWPTKRPPST